MSESDHQDDFWYYNIEGHEQGPVLLSRLRQMARRGMLASNDLVRRGKLGDWVSADSVDVIVVKPRAAIKADSLERTPPIVVSNEPGQLRQMADACKERLSDLTSDAVRAVVDRLWLVRIVAGYLALAIVLACMIRLTIGANLFRSMPAVDPLVMYRSMSKELKTHRDSHVDGATWSEFTTRCRTELGPVLARLDREAGSMDRRSQLLLWAGRDCLSKMLDDARTAPSQSERQFDEYLANVERLQAGEPIYGGNAGQQRTRDTGNFSMVQWFAQEPATAALTVLLSAANGVIVLWFAAVFLRRQLTGQPT